MPVQKKIIELRDLGPGDQIHMFVRARTADAEKCVVTFVRNEGLSSVFEVSNGTFIYLGVSTPLVKVGDHYEIAFDREEDEK